MGCVAPGEEEEEELIVGVTHVKVGLKIDSNDFY